MNWKEKIKELLDKKNIKENTIHHTYEYLYKAIPDLMIEFAKLACEKQKEICSAHTVVNRNYVLNSETINFEEDVP